MAWATPNDATHSVPPTRAPSPPIRVNLEPGITHLLPLGRTVRQASGGGWCGNSPRFVRLGWADRLRVAGARGRRGRAADPPSPPRHVYSRERWKSWFGGAAEGMWRTAWTLTL